MKYKLIKEYPGSPILRTIVDLEKSVNGQIVQGKWCYDIDKTPEFWELVIEKDYEILSLRSFDIIEDLENDETINMLIKQGCSIHSVKRLSDGEIFTIGDRIKPSMSKIQKIIGFQNPCDNDYFIQIETGYAGLKNIEKIKQSLFTTEDGVDIFEGDNYITITNIFLCSTNKAALSNPPHPQFKHFSTKEKAEEYTLLNKPCLSLKEIKETTTIKGLSLKKLEQLIQKKLNNN